LATKADVAELVDARDLKCLARLDPISLSRKTQSFEPVQTGRAHRDLQNIFAVVQRDDGTFSIGLADDAPGPFPTRRFAEQIAFQETLNAGSAGQHNEQTRQRAKLTGLELGAIEPLAEDLNMHATGLKIKRRGHRPSSMEGRSWPTHFSLTPST
jgi:hypothetical protein